MRVVSEGLKGLFGLMCAKTAILLISTDENINVLMKIFDVDF
jgi:hypothetical protein